MLCEAIGYHKRYYGRYVTWWHGNVLSAKTIIQSEIEDGDEELIRLRGKYSGEYFYSQLFLQMAIQWMQANNKREI